jgi:hypothetical protein
MPLLVILLGGTVLFLGGQLLGLDPLAPFRDLIERMTNPDSSSSIEAATSDVLSDGGMASTEVPPSNPTGQATHAGSRQYKSAGAPVTTQATSFEGSATLPYVMPLHQPKVPSTANEQAARSLAPQLEAQLVANPDGPNYRTKNTGLENQVKQFQRYLGLGADGLYGPQTAGALMYFLGHSPPPPFFYAPPRSIMAYLPTP